MEWSEVVAHPSLRDLPFKIELNEYGSVVMTPVKIKHSVHTGRISRLMGQMRAEGEVLVECAIKTGKGTKVADVAWSSPERFGVIENDTDASIAPEVCVEVVSASNTDKEMKGKRELYFESGAQEVWTCDESGGMRFFNAKRELKRSRLFPDFPERIEV
ncbi:MAG: Uma2 family endonuclease [Pyrinomonadaceae bacterium MAG19_C2-C3]|nr:Uma2 family endonuclease [Pyrinomonadaceae bacterium MAG19_C2-C3]